MLEKEDVVADPAAAKVGGVPEPGGRRPEDVTPAEGASDAAQGVADNLGQPEKVAAKNDGREEEREEVRLQEEQKDKEGEDDC